LDMRDVDDPERSIQAYMDGIADGSIKVKDDKEWALFAWGSLSRTLHYAKLARIRRESGDTFGERLMNREAHDALDEENQSWETFMTWSEGATRQLGYSQSLKDMFNTYDQYRMNRGDLGLISSTQQKLIEFNRDMKRYEQFFDYNYETAGRYFKATADAYAALAQAYPHSEEAQAKSWYFNDVVDGYYKKRDSLYASLETAKPEDVGKIYSELRKVSDRANHDFENGKHPEWGTFPSPEAYSWSQKSPKDQDRLKARWVLEPAEWLTEFQRGVVGYDIPADKQDAVTKWADYQAALDHEMGVMERKYGITSSETAHSENLARMDALLAARAKKLGITEEVKQFDAPFTARVDHALDLTERTNRIVVPTWADPSGRMNSWKFLSLSAKSAMQQLEAMEIDPQGDNAIPTRELFTKFVIDARKQDSVLDDALTEIGLAIEKPNVYDLVDYLFFEKTFG